MAIDVITVGGAYRGAALEALGLFLRDRYIQYVRNLVIGLAILAVFGAIVLVFSVVENGGCLPWQTPTGVESSPFSGNQDTTSCR